MMGKEGSDPASYCPSLPKSSSHTLWGSVWKDPQIQVFSSGGVNVGPLTPIHKVFGRLGLGQRVVYRSWWSSRGAGHRTVITWKGWGHPEWWGHLSHSEHSEPMHMFIVFESFLMNLFGGKNGTMMMGTLTLISVQRFELSLQWLYFEGGLLDSQL